MATDLAARHPRHGLYLRRHPAALSRLQNGLPIAYGMVDPISGLVTQIAVDPKWRRKGIAKAMMAYWAQKFDLSAMSAGNIPDTDKDTCGFYRALGWENHVNQFVMQAKL